MGATLTPHKFHVVGGPSQDKGNFPIVPEISPVEEGQVTQLNPDPSKNRRLPINPKKYLEPQLNDERLEDTYGNQAASITRLREG